MQRFAVVVTGIFLALLLLDVAPCGSCGNQRPVERDEQTEPRPTEAAPTAAEAPAPAEPATPAEAPTPTPTPTE